MRQQSKYNNVEFTLERIKDWSITPEYAGEKLISHKYSFVIEGKIDKQAGSEYKTAYDNLTSKFLETGKPLIITINGVEIINILAKDCIREPSPKSFKIADRTGAYAFFDWSVEYSIAPVKDLISVYRVYNYQRDERDVNTCSITCNVLFSAPSMLGQCPINLKAYDVSPGNDYRRTGRNYTWDETKPAELKLTYSYAEEFKSYPNKITSLTVSSSCSQTYDSETASISVTASAGTETGLDTLRAAAEAEFERLAGKNAIITALNKSENEYTNSIVIAGSVYKKLSANLFLRTLSYDENQPIILHSKLGGSGGKVLQVATDAEARVTENIVIISDIMMPAVPVGILSSDNNAIETSRRIEPQRPQVISYDGKILTRFMLTADFSWTLLKAGYKPSFAKKLSGLAP